MRGDRSCQLRVILTYSRRHVTEFCLDNQRISSLIGVPLSASGCMGLTSEPLVGCIDGITYFKNKTLSYLDYDLETLRRYLVIKTEYSVGEDSD